MQVLIVLAIITLCICNMAVLGSIVFLILNREMIIKSKRDCQGSNDRESSGPVLSPKEKSDLEEQKRRYIEQEEAFQKMMNYNAYQAYGISNKED